MYDILKERYDVALYRPALKTLLQFQEIGKGNWEKKYKAHTMIQRPGFALARYDSLNCQKTEAEIKQILYLC